MKLLKFKPSMHGTKQSFPNGKQEIVRRGFFGGVFAAGFSTSVVFFFSSGAQKGI